MFWTCSLFCNISFLFEKMLRGLRAIFLRLLVRTEENKSMRKFVCFSTTNIFVPVSQLSTRDLFYFLENLKIKQDILSWVSRLVWSLGRRALWFPYSRLFFRTKCSRKCEFLNIWGVFKVNCGVDIGFFDISYSERCLNGWLVNENHNSEFWVSCSLIHNWITRWASCSFD